MNTKTANNVHGYNVCFLDILGFTNKLEKTGLKRMLDYYMFLKNDVDSKKLISDFLLDDKENGDSMVWTSDGNITPLYKVDMALLSDSILIWSNRTWTTRRNTNKPIDDTKISWINEYRPPEIFLRICSEMICRSIEFGLPVRGSISKGECYMDKEQSIYLGMPICEAVKTENLQTSIGAGFCHSFFEGQIVPNQYRIEYAQNRKDGTNESILSDNVLNWPAHWVETRKESVLDVLNHIDFGNNSYLLNSTMQLIKTSAMQKNISLNMFDQYPNIFKKHHLFPVRCIQK